MEMVGGSLIHFEIYVRKAPRKFVLLLTICVFVRFLKGCQKNADQKLTTGLDWPVKSKAYCFKHEAGYTAT